MIGRGFGQRPLRSAPRSERAASGGSCGASELLLGRPHGAEGLLRGQLSELCAVFLQNNPTCLKLTWGFILDGYPACETRGG